MDKRRTLDRPLTVPADNPPTVRKAKVVLQLGVACVTFSFTTFSATIVMRAWAAEDPTEIPFIYPYEGDTEAVIKSSVEVRPTEGGGDPKPGEETQPFLRVRVKKGNEAAYRKRAGQRKLLDVFNGKAGLQLNKDLDSGQFAVRWTKEDGQVAGAPFSNAVDPRIPKRTLAARWDQEPDKPNEIYKDCPIPLEATRVEVVLIYTDFFDGHASQAEDDADGHGNNRGDMPGIIGSWTGTRNEGRWVLTPHPGEILASGQEFFPTVGQKEAMATSVGNLLRNRTGYYLRKRTDADSAYNSGYDICVEQE